MSTPCNPWWRNCALQADEEILKIDRMENAISPLRPNVKRIRELISTFELCHHKAQRWIDNILEAIATGDTSKGLGSRPPGQFHAAERVWQDACKALAEWRSGQFDPQDRFLIGSVPKAQLLAGLGARSPLKEWQVQRVMDRIRSLIHWPQFEENPETSYEWILLGGGAYEASCRRDCPPRYRDHEDFWQTTVSTKIQDTNFGQDAELSLGLAIDMLWPCHWDFLGNLQIVLDAIGGQLHPRKPFAACGRNITRVPNQRRLRRIVATLRTFCDSSIMGDLDETILKALRKPTPQKRWLAASLAKTIELQLDPPTEMRAASSLAGPA